MFKNLALVAAVSLALVGGANAATISATSALNASASPFALLPLGQANTNGLVSTAPISFSGGTISFTNTAAPSAGLYDGNVIGTAVSPYRFNTLPASNYLVAEPGDSVNILFNAAQTSFSLLWGSVDNYNSLSIGLFNNGTFIGTTTVTGSQVATAAGISSDGSTPAFVSITGLPSFNQIQALSTANAFEFVPGAPSSTAVPEPATLALLGMGLAGVGLVRRRRQG